MNLSKSKSSAPITGLSEVKEPALKKQKTEEATTSGLGGDWKQGWAGDGATDEIEECINCGS